MLYQNSLKTKAFLFISISLRPFIMRERGGLRAVWVMQDNAC